MSLDFKRANAMHKLILEPMQCIRLCKRLTSELSLSLYLRETLRQTSLSLHRLKTLSSACLAVSPALAGKREGERERERDREREREKERARAYALHRRRAVPLEYATLCPTCLGYWAIWPIYLRRLALQKIWNSRFEILRFKIRNSEILEVQKYVRQVCCVGG